MFYLMLTCDTLELNTQTTKGLIKEVESIFSKVNTSLFYRV